MILLTSTLFGTNVAHAILKGCWGYGLAFAALTVTSWWYHGTGTYDDKAAFLLDQLAIIMVVLVGAYYLSKQSLIQIILPVATFVGVCVIYKHGFSHEFVQLLCSFGHHCIMAGIV